VLQTVPRRSLSQLLPPDVQRSPDPGHLQASAIGLRDERTVSRPRPDLRLRVKSPTVALAPGTRIGPCRPSPPAQRSGDPRGRWPTVAVLHDLRRARNRGGGAKDVGPTALCQRSCHEVALRRMRQRDYGSCGGLPRRAAPSTALDPDLDECGAHAHWRADGRELFYLALDEHLTAVPLSFHSDVGTVEAGTPESLFAPSVSSCATWRGTSSPRTASVFCSTRSSKKRLRRSSSS
jgi:hypothetical protein